MKKLCTVIGLILACITSAFLFCSCSDGGGAVTYAISGESDICLTISDTESTLDTSAVKGTSTTNGTKKTETVTKDVSGINFGKKGRYDLVYTCGTEHKTVNVYIYDTSVPVISGATDKTVDYQSGINVLDGVTAKDQFDKVVTVTYEIFVGNEKADKLVAGENTVKYTATDAVGNTANLEAEYNLTLPGVKLVYENEEVSSVSLDLSDLSKLDFVFADDEDNAITYDLQSVKIGDATVENENYSYESGILSLKSGFVKDLTLDTQIPAEIRFVYLDSNIVVLYNLTVTDNKLPAFTAINGNIEDEYMVSSEITLPQYEKNDDSYQKIAVEYLLTKDGEEQQIDPSYTIAEAAVGDYVYTVKFKRGDTEVKSEVFEFSVKSIDRINFAQQKYVSSFAIGDKAAAHYNDAEWDAEKNAIKFDGSSSGIYHFNEYALLALKGGYTDLKITFTSESVMRIGFHTEPGTASATWWTAETPFFLRGAMYISCTAGENKTWIVDLARIPAASLVDGVGIIVAATESKSLYITNMTFSKPIEITDTLDLATTEILPYYSNNRGTEKPEYTITYSNTEGGVTFVPNGHDCVYTLDGGFVKRAIDAGYKSIILEYKGKESQIGVTHGTNVWNINDYKLTPKETANWATLKIDLEALTFTLDNDAGIYFLVNDKPVTIRNMKFSKYAASDFSSFIDKNWASADLIDNWQCSNSKYANENYIYYDDEKQALALVGNGNSGSYTFKELLALAYNAGYKTITMVYTAVGFGPEDQAPLYGLVEASHDWPNTLSGCVSLSLEETETTITTDIKTDWMDTNEKTELVKSDGFGLVINQGTIFIKSITVSK